EPVLPQILRLQLPNPSVIHESLLIIPNHLTPSHTPHLNKQFLQPFLTNIPPTTTHSPIITPSLQIPALLRTKSITKQLNQRHIIILDGLTNHLIIHPTQHQLIPYQNKPQ
ncbi:PEP-utilizing enzyme, partial [Staphylococcus warneri]|uniref:PEP-utilizing enzyme n=1 Tax=Staphylococcus warneri TaxID=1292 RepID=UPI0021B2F2CC